LEQWLVQDSCRLVAVLGLGGIGKTSLVAQAAHAAAGHFERVLWRSLLNAPPLDRLLAGLLQSLTDQARVELPTMPDEQFDLLFASLRQQRVLLVLDNLESILDPEQAGHFRRGYELYDQLLWRAATSEHRSALLLTSRERPDAVARLKGDSARVRSLQLKGLDQVAGEELLSERGVGGPFGARSALVTRYSGNPLALKLVADTVQELFAGNAESFLAEDTLIFDDVRQILDQQLTRLTEMEQTILFWLAIEREVVNAQDLRHDLVQPLGYLFLEALRGLQNRSLIERHRDGIGLQNVVLEYLTERLVETACAEIYAEQLDLLHRHALLKSQANDDVRQSQQRLILTPIAEQLIALLGKTALEEKIRNLLVGLRRGAPRQPSYAAGNLLNLLLHLGSDVTGYDFSHLSVWQADLRGANLAAVNLSGADLSGSAFTEDFGRIFAVAIHPEGQLVAAGGAHGAVRVWSLADGQRAGFLTGHTNAVMSVAWSPDGTLLASGSLDCTIRLWHWPTGRCLKVLSGHSSGVFAVAFRPDGAWLASGGQDGSVRLWEVGTGRELDVIEHTSVVFSLAYHPTGELLAAGSMDHSVYLWDLSSLRSASSQEGASTGTKPVARLLDTLTGHEHQVHTVAFSADGSLLASGSSDTTVCLWSVAERRMIRTLNGHAHWVRGLVFSPDGSRLISGSADRSLRIWDVAEGRTLEILRGHEHTVRAVAIDPDGSILASGGLDDTIRLWDLRRTQHEAAVRTIRGHVSAIHSLAFSPEGDTLAIGDGKGWVRLCPLPASQLEALPPHTLPGRGMQVNCVSFSPDGKWLASADDDRIVRIWARASSQNVGMLYGHKEAVHSVRHAPQGNVLISAGYEGNIYLWDISAPAQGRLLAVLSGHTLEINDLLITPDGNYIISGSSDNTLRVWEFATGRCIQVLEEANGHSKSLALDPCKLLVAAAGWSGDIRLYRLDEEKRLEHLRSFKAHATRVAKIALSPDGTRIASCGLSGIIRLWEVGTGRQLQSLHGHTQPVQALAFHPSGKLLASGGEDESVRLWTLTDEPPGSTEFVLRFPGPYAGMNIAGATGISEAQRSALKALGAVETRRER
jgi:WD40 repeat protein